MMTAFLSSGRPAADIASRLPDDPCGIHESPSLCTNLPNPVGAPITFATEIEKAFEIVVRKIEKKLRKTDNSQFELRLCRVYQGLTSIFLRKTKLLRPPTHTTIVDCSETPIPHIQTSRSVPVGFPLSATLVHIFSKNYWDFSRINLHQRPVITENIEFYHFRFDFFQTMQINPHDP